jgi:hypothetical protein
LRPLQHAIEDALASLEAIKGTDDASQLIMPDDRPKDGAHTQQRSRRPISMANTIAGAKREPELLR